MQMPFQNPMTVLVSFTNLFNTKWDFGDFLRKFA